MELTSVFLGLKTASWSSLGSSLTFRGYFPSILSFLFSLSTIGGHFSLLACSTAISRSLSTWAHQKLPCSLSSNTVLNHVSPLPRNLWRAPISHNITPTLPGLLSRPSSNSIDWTCSTFHLLISLTANHAEPRMPIVTSLPSFRLFPLPRMPFLDPCLIKLGPSCTFLVHLTDLFLFELLKHYKCLFCAL